jgi:hypothetical protein
MLAKIAGFQTLLHGRFIIENLTCVNLRKDSPNGSCGLEQGEFPVSRRLFSGDWFDRTQTPTEASGSKQGIAPIWSSGMSLMKALFDPSIPASVVPWTCLGYCHHVGLRDSTNNPVHIFHPEVEGLRWAVICAVARS